MEFWEIVTFNYFPAIQTGCLTVLKTSYLLRNQLKKKFLSTPFSEYILSDRGWVLYSLFNFLHFLPCCLTCRVNVYQFKSNFFLCRESLYCSPQKYRKNRVCHTAWNKSEREKPILHINSYVWNLGKKWYRWTCLQGRSRDTDLENGPVEIVGERGGWDDLREHHRHCTYHQVSNRQVMGSCCVAQGALLCAPRWPRRVGWQGWWGGSRGRAYVCTYNRSPVALQQKLTQHWKAIMLQLKHKLKYRK